MDPIREDPQKAPDDTLNPGSISPAGKEAGPIQAPDITMYVQPAPEMQRAEIPAPVAEAGVTHGQDNVVIRPEAFQGTGMTTHNPSVKVSTIEITLPAPIGQLRREVHGDPESGTTGRAMVGVFQEDRRDLLEGLPEAA